MQQLNRSADTRLPWQRTVLYSDIWKLSVRDNAEYALYVLNGKKVLFSGTSKTVICNPNYRPSMHTHPPDIIGDIDPHPSLADISALNIFWGKNPQLTQPPTSVIIWGPKPVLGDGATKFSPTGFNDITKKK